MAEIQKSQARRQVADQGVDPSHVAGRTAHNAKNVQVFVLRVCAARQAIVADVEAGQRTFLKEDNESRTGRAGEKNKNANAGLISIARSPPPLTDTTSRLP